MLQVRAADGRQRNPLKGKRIFIPPMAYGSGRTFAAAFRALGLDADITPPSDHRTRELGARYTSGDECYPAKVTIGDFMKLLEQPGTDPAQVALFMPTADGPCRFGQYTPYLRSILAKNGYPHTEVIAPSSNDGYGGLRRHGEAVRAHRLARADRRRHSAEDAAAAPAVRVAEGQRGSGVRGISRRRLRRPSRRRRSKPAFN